MLFKYKGISLIVLIITIIIIIILAGVVILSLSENNPIISAQEATFKNDVTSMQTELDMYISKMYLQNLGTFDIATVDGEVSEYIPNVNKYDDTFDIVDGKLIYSGSDTQTLAYARNMNLDIVSDYDGAIEIVQPTTNVINTSEGTVEAWVNVTSLMREEVAEKYIFSTYSDEKYTNTIALRHTRDNTWQAIMASDYNNVSDISVADTLIEGWHLFSLKWSPTEFSLFIDGVKVATDITPSLMLSVSTDLHIGKGPKLNLIKNGYVTTGDNTNFPNLTYNTGDFTSASSSLKAIGPLYGVSSNQFIPVDTNKVFYESGQFKSVGTAGNSITYYGVSTYDKDKQYIDDTMTNHYINTETELVQDLKPGDTIVYVKNSINWKKLSDSINNKFIGIYPYNDYPIYTYTRKCYAFSDSNMVNNTITLTSAYTGPLVPLGTKIANHYRGLGNYTYNTICGSSIPSTWTKYSSNISTSMINVNSWNKFRYGTKYIKILFYFNYVQTSNHVTLSDDLEFIDTTDTIFDSKIQELCISNTARSDSDILNRFKTGILSKDSNVTYMLTEQ